MIPTITNYWYRIQRNKVEMMTRAEKRKAVMFVCGITACVTALVYLWLLK
jgi:hypothetical protein